MKDAVRGLKKFFQPRPQYITRSVGCEGGERSLALTGTALPEKMPRHVAIIMDGNGRWATRRGLPRSAGHAAGTEALRDIIRATDDWGIEALTIYAFSTENWSRGKDEVQALMGLLLKYFNSEIDELDEKNVRITILGDVQGMPSPQKEALIRAMERTGKNTGLRRNIALNYGGRGEMRLSNFLPWQTAYADMVFDSTLWPDFTRQNYLEDIRIYASRDRRFGGVKTGK